MQGKKKINEIGKLAVYLNNQIIGLSMIYKRLRYVSIYSSRQQAIEHLRRGGNFNNHAHGRTT